MYLAMVNEAIIELRDTQELSIETNKLGGNQDGGEQLMLKWEAAAGIKKPLAIDERREVGILF